MPMAPGRTTAHRTALAWIIFHLLIAAATTALFIILTVMTGSDIIRLYFQTSYFFYPLALLTVPAVLVMLAVTLAAAGIHELRHDRFFSPPLPILSLVMLLAAVCFTAAGTGMREYHLRRHGAEPSARERFWARVGPVVQLVPSSGNGSSGIISIWYFDPIPAASSTRIIFGREPMRERMSAAEEIPGSDGRRHEFHLTGLSPTARYYYSIPAWGKRIYEFSPPPAPDSRGPVRFICLGDTGNTRAGGYSQSYFGSVMRAADRHYREQGATPAFLVHAGDIVRTGADLDGWLRHFTSFDSSSLPLIMTVGNHEFMEDYGGNYRYFFGGPLYYSFDYGPVHFISLNAFDGPGIGFDGPMLSSPLLSTGAGQYDFVKRDLAASDGKKWIVVILHIPILSTGDFGSSEILLTQYRDLFKKYRVDLVIAGHDHNFDSFMVDPKTDWGGTVYIVAGTGGSAVDSYIMDRAKRKWNTWYHDRASEHGLYQRDEMTERYHVYGELSWGFTDVMIQDDTLTVTYCRWLDLPAFLDMTGQNRYAWEMIYLDERTWAENNLSDSVAVKTITKKRLFLPGKGHERK